MATSPEETASASAETENDVAAAAAGAVTIATLPAPNSSTVFFASASGSAVQLSDVAPPEAPADSVTFAVFGAKSWMSPWICVRSVTSQAYSASAPATTRSAVRRPAHRTTVVDASITIRTTAFRRINCCREYASSRRPVMKRVVPEVTGSTMVPVYRPARVSPVSRSNSWPSPVGASPM